MADTDKSTETEIKTEAEAAPKPKQDPAEAESKKVDPVKEGLIEKSDKGFQPAKTMTPAEFERLFSEMDGDDK